jgi:hypothetical protein
MASNLSFILSPAVNASEATTEVERALRVFRDILDAAVANPSKHFVFTGASSAFRQICDDIALTLGIKGATNPEFFKDAWWFNLSVAGFAATGITAEQIRTQLDALEGRTDLTSRLALQPALNGYDSDRYSSHVFLAVDGKRVYDGTVQERNAVDHALGASLMFGKLAEVVPLLETPDPEKNYPVWRYNIYRLALELLGYRPTS